jgi:Rap1a immunity proteins
MPWASPGERKKEKFVRAAVAAWACADSNVLLRQCGAAVERLDRGVAEWGMRDLPKYDDSSFCIDFVQGITQSNLLYEGILKDRVKDKAQFCLPSGGITNAQAARVVVKYLRDHPEELHRHEFTLAFWAFKDAFPCQAIQR